MCGGGVVGSKWLLCLTPTLVALSWVELNSVTLGFDNKIEYYYSCEGGPEHDEESEDVIDGGRQDPLFNEKLIRDFAQSSGMTVEQVYSIGYCIKSFIWTASHNYS